MVFDFLMTPSYCSFVICQAFETLPVKLEDIEAAIHEEQARADCAFNTDGSVSTLRQ